MVRFALLLTGLALVSGCGGLTKNQQASVLDAEAAITSTAANGSRHDDAVKGVDDLIAIYRAEPNAKFDGTTIREHLQDMAGTLEPYEPEMAAKLDRVLNR